MGCAGRDVVCDQHALMQAGVRPKAPADGRYDAVMAQQVRAFQRREKIVADGVIGVQTHYRLSRPRKGRPWGYYTRFEAQVMAAVRRKIIAHSKHILTVGDVVSRCVAAALLTYRNRDAIHYTQGPARMGGVRFGIMPPHFPEFEDCSSMYTWWKFAAGAPDPNDLGYNGEGYTGTQANHGEYVIDPSAPGTPLTTAVFYGGSGSDTEHVAMVVSSGMVVSHGSEGGPYLIPVMYRGDMRWGRLHSNAPRAGAR